MLVDLHEHVVSVLFDEDIVPLAAGFRWPHDVEAKPLDKRKCRECGAAARDNP